jgi:hypothetical protein
VVTVKVGRPPLGAVFRPYKKKRGRREEKRGERKERERERKRERE